MVLFSLVTPDVRFTLSNYEGPLHILLELVESQQMPITSISLGSVTEQFLAFLQREQHNVPMETLADFLVVAAKLMYLKSKVFLPEMTSEEETQRVPLERQLALFRKYLTASHQIHQLLRKKTTAYARLRPLQQVPFTNTAFPENVSTGALYQSMLKMVEQLSQIFSRQETRSVARVLSIRDMIQRMRETLSVRLETQFYDMIAKVTDRNEVVVMFLALLELVKQRFLVLEQHTLFEGIRITRIEMQGQG